MRLIFYPERIYTRTLSNVLYMLVHRHVLKSSTTDAFTSLNFRLIKTNGVKLNTKPYSRLKMTKTDNSERET